MRFFHPGHPILNIINKYGALSLSNPAIYASFFCISQTKNIHCPRHGNIKQAPLLFDIHWPAPAPGIGNQALFTPCDKHNRKLQAFGGMDRHQGNILGFKTNGIGILVQAQGIDHAGQIRMPFCHRQDLFICNAVLLIRKDIRLQPGLPAYLAD